MFSVIAFALLVITNINSLKHIPSVSNAVFVLLVFWSVCIVVRSFTFQIQDWVTNFGNVYMALAWFTPALIVVGQKVENWQVLFQVIFFMLKIMLVSMFFLPFYVGDKLPTEWTWLIRSINFLIIIGIKRFRFQEKALLIASFFVYILIAIETQQRIEFVYLFIVFLFVFVDKLKPAIVKQGFFKTLIFSFLIVVLLIFTYGYENINILVNTVVEFKDTRTFLFKELMTELNGTEKIFGRGSLGMYHSDYFERTIEYYKMIGAKNWMADDPDRITIEVGYLQMILKGGFLLFFLQFFMMFYSVYLALFKSRNKFSRRLGIFVLIISVLSIISFRPAFTPTFIILWISIGTILNRRNRNLEDQEIEKLISIY